MSVTRRMTIAVFSLIGSSLCLTQAWAARPAASAVMHRGEVGAPVNVDLGGAPDFIISVSCAGDGLASNQGVPGDAKVT